MLSLCLIGLFDSFIAHLVDPSTGKAEAQRGGSGIGVAAQIGSGEIAEALAGGGEDAALRLFAASLPPSCSTLRSMLCTEAGCGASCGMVCLWSCR